MRKLCLFALLCALSFQVARSLQQPTRTERQVTPLTIVERELANETVEADRITFIRSDGAKAVRSLTTGKHNTGSEARNVLLPKERKYVVIADRAGMISTFYLGPEIEQKAGKVASSEQCLATIEGARMVGTESILGFPVNKFEMVRPVVRGTGHKEQYWLAPSLDCRPLRFIEEAVDETGNIIKKFQRTALSVRIGEPDDQEFRIPEGYREAPPSEASRSLREIRLRRPLGNDPSDARLLSAMDRMDKKYNESRQYKP